MPGCEDHASKNVIKHIQRPGQILSEVFKYITEQKKKYKHLYISYLDISCQDISYQNISYQDISYQDISSQDISSQDISSQDISSQDISSQDISYQDTSQDKQYVPSLVHLGPKLIKRIAETQHRFIHTFTFIYKVAIVSTEQIQKLRVERSQVNTTS